MEPLLEKIRNGIVLTSNEWDRIIANKSAFKSASEILGNQWQTGVNERIIRERKEASLQKFSGRRK
jgi:hypothetical protein